MEREDKESIVNESGAFYAPTEAVESHGRLSVAEAMEWLGQQSVFIAAFQSEDDYRNAMKAKGNKYGNYTEHAIEETLKYRRKKLNRRL